VTLYERPTPYSGFQRTQLRFVYRRTRFPVRSLSPLLTVLDSLTEIGRACQRCVQSEADDTNVEKSPPDLRRRTDRRCVSTGVAGERSSLSPSFLVTPGRPTSRALASQASRFCLYHGGSSSGFALRLRLGKKEKKAYAVVPVSRRIHAYMHALAACWAGQAVSGTEWAVSSSEYR
jgi:hypothetical protein